MKNEFTRQRTTSVTFHGSRSEVRSEGGGWLYPLGAVTSLQTLKTLGVFDVAPVTKGLQRRYRPLHFGRQSAQSGLPRRPWPSTRPCAMTAGRGCPRRRPSPLLLT